MAAREYFADRAGVISAFQLRVNAANTDKVLVFYGVGGIGKTTLVQHLAKELRDSKVPIPCALFSMENIGDQTRAYREVLLRWRCDLESQFGISFPHFDLCLGVMLAGEGGDPPPLFQRPSLKPWLEFGGALINLPLAHDAVSLPIHVASTLIKETVVEKSSLLEEVVRRIGGSEEVLRLRERALRDDQTLPDELIRRFAHDLSENLPVRNDRGCRGVLFLDTYEKLWTGREAAASTQARLLDEWVRTLAGYCLGSGVLFVISGRDRLSWVDSAPEWQEGLEQHLLGGLSFEDAQTFLARCRIGSSPLTHPTSPLQRAIIMCCNESSSSDISVHPLYLALCAEIVLNTRKVTRIDPKPNVFSKVPTQQIAEELAAIFLRSLHSGALELWIQELSLTPRFDEDAALALDDARHHQNGRSGWDQLIRFSFVERQPDGFYRLHKTMRDVLRAGVSDAKVQESVHEWFREYWTERNEPVLAWYHLWIFNPDGALREWEERHETALKALKIAEARHLLTWWGEVALDASDRSRIGDELWGKTHLGLASALWRTPITPRTTSLTAAIEHCQAALEVFAKTTFPHYWAKTQHNLGVAYALLPTGDRTANLRRAIACYEAALQVRTEVEFPHEWAMTQNNLGIAYWSLPTGDRAANLRQAIACFEAALRVLTETSFPYEWSVTQNNLGNAYGDLPTDRTANVRQAIACYEAALRVRTEAELPQEWAMTQNNLGEMYALLPGDRTANLRQAIAYFEAALRVRTESDFPLDWATTQHNLGNAYAVLPTGDRGENLGRAIACYDAALRVRTEATLPREWAGTMHHLGEAHRELPRDREKNLRTAIEHYEAALKVRTETAFPRDWADTQHALGLAYQDLSAVTGDTEYSFKAEEHFAVARRIKQSSAT